MKYIFLDIDGTLYDNRLKSIPESASRAVKLAAAKGNRIFICTGRSCCMLNHVEHLPFDGVIAAAGAYVRIGEKLIFEESIPHEDLLKIEECCQELGISYILEGNIGVYFQAEAKQYFGSGSKKGNSAEELFKQAVFCDIGEYDSNKDIIYKLCIYVKDDEMLSAFRMKLPEKYHLTTGGVGLSNAHCIELTLKRNNKASGIRRVIEYFGGRMEDTLAVGDSMNDMEMIEECEIGIAMGNANDKLKEISDYVTADIDKDGIYQVFERYGLI